MISFSSASMVPPSVPSVIIILISSSVTVLSVEGCTLNMRKTKLVTVLSSHTIGKVALANNFIGVATMMAIFSARNKPKRLGNNSPKMIERNVTAITMSTVEIVCA